MKLNYTRDIFFLKNWNLYLYTYLSWASSLFSSTGSALIPLPVSPFSASISVTSWMWNIYLLFNWIAQTICDNIGLVDMYIYMCTATDYWLFGWRSKYNFWACLQHEAVNRNGKPHRFIGDRDIYIKKLNMR